MLSVASFPQRALEVAIKRVSTSSINNNRLQLSVSKSPLSIYRPETQDFSELFIDSFTVCGWRFIISINNRCVASIPVYLSVDGTSVRTGGVETASQETGLGQVLSVASNLIESDEVHELRSIEIPWLSLTYLWITGNEPIFIDWASGEQSSEQRFSELLNTLAEDITPNNSGPSLGR